MPEASIAAAELRDDPADNAVTYPLAPFLQGEPLQRYLHYKRRYQSILDAGDGDLPSTFEATQYCLNLVEAHGADVAAEAVRSGNVAVLSWLTGLTQQEVDASTLTLPVRLLKQLRNDGAPAFMSAAGNPETGKTNTAIKLLELRAEDLDDHLVISNVRSWSGSDLTVTSMHDLAVALLEHRDVPKLVLIDEGSTHFDARTNRREVAEQYTPVAKRYAKLNVDVETVIVHTGKDLHPERKRLSTLAFYKLEKELAEFFADWPADSDKPETQLFGGVVEAIEKADGYEPDDSAPWAWNLEPELFAEDLSWPDLLDELQARGPVNQ